MVYRLSIRAGQALGRLKLSNFLFKSSERLHASTAVAMIRARA
jgi:hypothetical protein